MLPNVRQRLAEHMAWTKAQKRVQRLPEADLLAWWETTLYASQRMREAYERTQDILALSEARTDIVSLVAILEELDQRSNRSSSARKI
ncbi:hypothetical protein [Streptomyces sp. CBMA29]|uniref:hypothetical protein n=1 Tax=Streptomyces sp. CBMA29 TaxID=1896314 RepID=UPI001661E1B3|nr:hypothetical protein [Streptomyces sp. CBMA29]MBD0734044.1 hypothetical protein [Streptomyces sp. CBMA29]